MESNNIYSPENMEAMKKNFFTDYEITEGLSELQKNYLDNLTGNKNILVNMTRFEPNESLFDASYLANCEKATVNEVKVLVNGILRPEGGI
jgi:hypothetical protein